MDLLKPTFFAQGGAKVPQRNTGDAGFDLRYLPFRPGDEKEYPEDNKKTKKGYGLDHVTRSNKDGSVTIQPGETVALFTGLRLWMPKHLYAQIKDRSSMALKGLQVGGGVIDSNYRGLICVIIRNLGDKPYTVQPGDRVAQLVFLYVWDDDPVGQVNQVEWQNLIKADLGGRGVKGFGSSGKQ
jgi:dUTP pyrophosphatase